MKLNYQTALVVCFIVALVGCHEEPIGDGFAGTNYQPRGAVVSPGNVQLGFFDLGDPANAGIAFDLQTKGEAVTSAEVTATHENGASTVYTTVSSFPTTVDVPMLDLLSALNLTVDDVEVGDEVLFTFNATTASGAYRSSESLLVPFSCNSELEGTYDYTSTNYFCSGGDLTGTVTLNEEAAGRYSFDDWSFGTYPECYGGSAAGWGSLRLVDVCNSISVSGVDNYGDSWEFSINSVGGSMLNATWSNTYGEFGTVILTRTDGSSWPPLSN